MLLIKTLKQYLSPYQVSSKFIWRQPSNDLKSSVQKLTQKFLVCDLDPKVTVMYDDAADKNFWLVSITIPSMN